MQQHKRNLHSLVFVCSLFSVLYMFDENIARTLSGTMTLAYFLQDFFLLPALQPDMVLHHCLGTLLIFFSPSTKWNKVVVVYETEWSTIFLSLMMMKIYPRIMTPAFVMSFLYFRLYRLGRLLLYDAEPTFVTFILQCLFGLNIYWQYYIVRKIVRLLHN